MRVWYVTGGRAQNRGWDSSFGPGHTVLVYAVVSGRTGGEVCFHRTDTRTKHPHGTEDDTAGLPGRISCVRACGVRPEVKILSLLKCDAYISAQKSDGHAASQLPILLYILYNYWSRCP